jgi:inner membrane protein involved in colicin E2 resistance
VYASSRVAAGQPVTFDLAYRSQGLDTWRYAFGEGVAQVRDFELVMSTNFADVDFPDNALSPTEKQKTPHGWALAWRYKNLLSGYQIALAVPQKLQPGPLAGQISLFAPVSLFFFFFLLFIITTLKNIELHPMNYFFLAGAFFSFHLLLAYLADHISIHLAFAICSVVSIFLVVSYLRLVVGSRFAFLEAGLAQFVYLVLFSYTFFLEGYTGLSVTIGSILTLFIVMQKTGRVRWGDKFSGRAPASG